MKYPIGIQSFESIRQDGYLYLDKTALVFQLVERGFTRFLIPYYSSPTQRE